MGRGVGRPAAAVVLSEAERRYLERQVRRHRVARALAERCRMILRCAEGVPNKVVAAELGVHAHTVGKWRRRFVQARLAGLGDEPRPGRPRTIADEAVAQVIERTLTTTPPDATRLVPALHGQGERAVSHSRFAESGRPLACSPTARSRFSSPATHCSSRKSATSLGSIWRPRTGQW